MQRPGVSFHRGPRGEPCPLFQLGPIKATARRTAVVSREIVGRLDGDDIEAAEAQLRATNQQTAENQHLQEAKTKAERLLVAEAIKRAAEFDARAIIATMPAEYGEVDEGRLRRIAALVEDRQTDEALLEAEWEKEVSQFGPRSVHAVPFILDTADVLALAHERALELGRQFSFAKASLVSGLELGRLRRRSQRLHRLLDTALRIKAWDDRIACVRLQLREERFTDVIETLGLEGRPYTTTGTPTLLGDTRLFDMEACFLRATGDSEDSPPAIKLEWTPEVVSEAGDDVIRTTIGASAVRRWLTLSNAQNPFLLDWIRRVTCRVLATPHMIRKFAVFAHGTTYDEFVMAVPQMPPLQQASTCPSAAGADGRSSPSNRQHRRRVEPTVEWSDDADQDEVRRDAEGSPTLTDEEETDGVPVRSSALSTPFSLRTLADGFAEDPPPGELESIQSTLGRVLDVLVMLRFTQQSVTRFFAECFQLALDFILLLTLAETLGEDQLSWEAIVDTLVPSELHRIIRNILAGMHALIRNARRLRDFCCATLARHEAEVQSKEEDIYLPNYEPPAPPPHQHLVGFHTTAVQKCMASLMALVTRVPLASADIGETLRFFQATLDFAKDCEPLSDDKSPAGTIAALVKLLTQRIETIFAGHLTEDLSKLLHLETFHPFLANCTDFTKLNMLMPPSDGAAASHGGAVGDLLEAVSCFTFSSLKVCQRMMQLTAEIAECPAGAEAVVSLAVTLACQYVWFVSTHVLAQCESVPLYEESGIKPHVRDAASTVAQWSFRLGAPPSFPHFPDAPCNGWKIRKADPSALYAALERTTALGSLDAVVAAAQMCLKSVSLLLSHDALDKLTTVVQHLVTMAQYAAQSGFRRIATNLCSAESIACTVERMRWEDKTLTGGEGSVLFRNVTETVAGLKDRLRPLMADHGAGRPINRLLLHVVFNVACGIIDGAGRVRKWGDNGRNALVADAKAIMKFMKGSVPFVSADLVTWVLRYVTALAAPAGAGEVERLYAEHHSLYTEKQLTALCERESFSRKRELIALLAKLGHVDKLPYSLVETRP